MVSDPSIHVDPRIKESTSCKTANRYYDEKRGEGGEGGGLGAIPKQSSSGDVILGNSQSVTFFPFRFSSLLRLLRIQSELVSAKIKRIATSRMTFRDNSENLIAK